jgi:hypothetical protein
MIAAFIALAMVLPFAIGGWQFLRDLPFLDRGDD